MQGFCLISLFSAFVLASATVISAHYSDSEDVHLSDQDILLTRQQLLRRASGKDQSQKDANPQRTNRAASPIPILYERPRPPPRKQRAMPQTSRTNLSSDSGQAASNLVDSYRIPGRIHPAGGRNTGYPPSLSQAQPQASSHDSRRPQGQPETFRQSGQRKDSDHGSAAHSSGQDIGRLQLEKTSPIKTIARPRPPSLKTEAPDTIRKSFTSLQSAQPSQISRTSLKTQHTPSKVNDNPFAKLAELDSSLGETLSSSPRSSPRSSPHKTPVTNKPQSKIPSQPIPLSQPERKVSSASTSLQGSSSNQGSAFGRSGQGLQDQGGSSERSTSKKKGRSKSTQKDEAKPEIAQPQSHQQIDHGSQTSIPSPSRTETDTRSSSQSARTTRIVENPIPEALLHKWGENPARGFVDPYRPRDMIDRMKEHPGIWARTSVYGKGPAQGNAATISEWTPLVESESKALLKASALHPRLAFAQAQSRTIRNRRGEAIDKGEITGKASGDHVWGYFRPGTTSPINIDWNKGDGRVGSTTLPARPADSDWMIVKESLNTDNPTARGPSFTAHTRGSGEFMLLAKMGSPPSMDDLSLM